MTKIRTVLATTAAAVATPAWAHPGHVGEPGGLHGLFHGIVTVESLVAIVAVGLFALFFMPYRRASAPGTASERARS